MSTTTSTTTAPAVLSCGHLPTRDDSTASRISTGYATTRDGRTLCYPCADESERAAFLVAGMTGQPFTAYVSSSGDLTTWTGGVLAHGVPYAHGVSRSGWHGSEVHSWRFRIGDATWYGRNGGPGMVITVRRTKR